MHWIDWAIVAIPITIVFWIGWKTQRYVKGVSDFLAGGRVAGRYLLAVAGMETSLAVVSLVAAFEKEYKTGFAIGFWSQIATLVGLVMTLTGFVVYRYRETRVMTLAQFFEIRYSKGFRVFAGIICYIAGILNYAIFPVVSARFFLYYCGLPATIVVGGVSLSTLGVLMAVFLAMALAILFMGGQLSCMVTDCVQGLFTYVIFTVILIALLFTFTPDQFRDVLLARPAGQSFINPFDTHNLTDFNVLFVLLGIMASVYGRMSWQGAAGYNCAAISPHEQKMGGVLSTWRDGFGRMKVPLLVMGAYILMNHPDFAPQAQAVKDELVARINLANPVTTETIRRQMMVPVALRHILPIGLTGAFVSLMLMAMVSTDTTYVQSWGSILVQDVILPLRKRPFTPRVQIWILRLSILGVAVFAWFFGMYFNQVTFILHFFAMTGALWGGFAGSVILGGLYWKRGTTAAAWTAAITGLLLGGFGFFCQTYWADVVYPWLSGHHPDFLAGFGNCLTWVGGHCPIAKWEIGPKKFPVSGVEWNSVTILCCVFGYVLVSLLTCREEFNLERMLHRGKYARDLKPGEKAMPMKSRITLRTFLGFTHEYSRGDKILAFSVLAWTLYNFLVFLVLVVWNVLIKPWPAHWWFNYFYYYGFGLALVVGLVTVVWFTWGGTRDLCRLFAHLRDLQRNVLDDGRVMGHVSADDVAMVEKVDHVVIAEAHRGDATAAAPARSEPGNKAG